MLRNKWIGVTETEIGLKHKRAGRSNQDAIEYKKIQYKGIQYKELQGVSAGFMAVSDGHGSDRCPKSDIGSKRAVEAALSVFETLTLDQLSTLFSHAPEERRAFELARELCPRIVANWREMIQKEEGGFSTSCEQNISSNSYLAYGATLSVVFRCNSFTIFMKLGDCEILWVDQEEKVGRPFGRSIEIVGEDTESLCMPNADQLMQCCVRRDNPSVQFYLVCSDGVEKAFVDNSAFEILAEDLAKMVKTREGLSNLKNNLKSWLKEYSEFSGDDVSIGLLFAKPSDRSHCGGLYKKHLSMSRQKKVCMKSKKSFVSSFKSQSKACIDKEVTGSGGVTANQ